MFLHRGYNEKLVSLNLKSYFETFLTVINLGCDGGGEEAHPIMPFFNYGHRGQLYSFIIFITNLNKGSIPFTSCLHPKGAIHGVTRYFFYISSILQYIFFNCLKV